MVNDGGAYLTVRKIKEDESIDTVIANMTKRNEG